MAKTGLYFDILGATVTPAGGSAVTLGNTTKAQVRMSDKQEMWQPGGARFATHSVISVSERGIDFEGGDVAKLAAIPRDKLCTVVVNFPDAENGSGEGALTVTLVRAKITDSSFGSSVRKFGMAGASFDCTSADGTTDPVTIAEAPAP